VTTADRIDPVYEAASPREAAMALPDPARPARVVTASPGAAGSNHAAKRLRVSWSSVASMLAPLSLALVVLAATLPRPATAQGF
jgi:hypothetical protein